MNKDCSTYKYLDKLDNEKPCCQCGLNSKWEPKDEKKVNKNYVKEFMDDNGLKIGEEFSIKELPNCVSMGKFYFEKDLRLYKKGFPPESFPFHLAGLLIGDLQIKPKPFSPTNLPKQNETIWVVTPTKVSHIGFDSVSTIYALVASGNAFRTEEEAEANAPRIRKEQGMGRTNGVCDTGGGQG